MNRVLRGAQEVVASQATAGERSAAAHAEVRPLCLSLALSRYRALSLSLSLYIYIYIYIYVHHLSGPEKVAEWTFRAGGRQVVRNLEAHISSQRAYLLNGFRRSTPPHIRQCIVYFY